MKLSNYVGDFLSRLSPRVYMVCGAGAMHLNDSICHHPGIEVIAMHHEQAATFAAEADARVTNNIGVVHVTAGPGVTNAMTGVACAYADSIPMLVVAGQVERRTLKGGGQRMNGISEVDGALLMEPITKYAVTIREPQTIAYHLERAVDLALKGRRGPVFIEIPLDVQNADIDPNKLDHFLFGLPQNNAEDDDIKVCRRYLKTAVRPILIIGNGVRLSGAEEELRAFLKRFHMPVVTGWSGRDIIPDYEGVLGSCGIIGNREANWAVQNADLILAVGTRLSYPQTGHHRELFAPRARKIVVDIDPREATKLNPDLAIVADCKAFLAAFASDGWEKTIWQSWIDGCRAHADPPPVYPEGDGINAYHFLDQLGKHLSDDAIVVTDVGTAFVATHQSLKLKRGQRLFHSTGIAPMGYGLPAAIGACFASGKKRQIVCLCGDGGIMFNLQELQTIAHHKLPISIFVYANNGYATMRASQDSHFGRLAVSDQESGVSFPDFMDVAAAFGIQAVGARSVTFAAEFAEKEEEPFLIVLNMAPSQAIAPRVISRMKDGKFVPTPIDEMWPYPEMCPSTSAQEAAE